MENNEIHEKIARHQRDLRDLTEKKTQRLKEIQSFRYASRKYMKLVLSIIPIGTLSIITYFAALYGYLPLAIAPILSVFGGRAIGGIAEYAIMSKFNKAELEKFDDYNDEASREKREIQLKLEQEKAKCEEYINEYEYNHTLNPSKKISSPGSVNKKNIDNSKLSYKDNLKRVNTKLVLERDYSIYKSKLEAILYHLGLTAGWAAPLGLLYAITYATMTGTLTPINLLLGFGISSLYNGYINAEVLNTRLKQYNKYRKESKMNIKDESLEALKELQKEYIDKIGRIELVQKYDVAITKPKEKELNVDPIQKQYDNSLDSIVEGYDEDKEQAQMLIKPQSNKNKSLTRKK